MTTLYRRGRVRSPVSPFTTAFVVDGGVIAWVGTEDGADAVTGVDTVVDLEDAVVLPAFVDAHVHSTAAGLAIGGLDLGPVRSRDELLAAVAAAHVPGRVLLGHGWDESSWPDRRLPTAAELDRATGGGAAYLTRADIHSALVTSDLLVGVEHTDGHVTLAAHHAVRKVALASVTAAQALDAQRLTRGHAASLGIGSLHEMAGPEVSSRADLEALLHLAATEPGPSVVAGWGAIGDVQTSLELGLGLAGGDLFCDGSLGSHTAALSTPYADGHHGSGTLVHDADAIAQHVLLCAQHGLQAGFHAIGDAAVDAVLTGLEKAAQVVGNPRIASGRHRMEHAENLSPADVVRMSRLGMVASVQPAFDAIWGGPAGMYADRLGAERALTLNPFAALAAAGVSLALGSDAPVTPLDPWGAVRAAVHHRTPGSGISARAAFTAHTRGGWRAARLEADGSGELGPGCPATFAVWDVPGELTVQVPDERVAGWSTDARASVAGLPDLAPGSADPVCLRTVVGGAQVWAL